MINRIIFIGLILTTMTLEAITPPKEISEEIILILNERSMAKKIYLKLYTTWEHDLFKKLAVSEQFYIDDLKKLIQDLNISNPTLENTNNFGNAYINSQYEKFLDIGNSSNFEAYRISATIQEMLIFDINQLLLKISDKTIISVLRKNKLGSIAHIRVCYKEIIKYGITYNPQFLSQEELAAILY